MISPDFEDLGVLLWGSSAAEAASPPSRAAAVQIPPGFQPGSSSSRPPKGDRNSFVRVSSVTEGEQKGKG